MCFSFKWILLESCTEMCLKETTPFETSWTRRISVLLACALSGLSHDGLTKGLSVLYTTTQCSIGYRLQKSNLSSLHPLEVCQPYFIVRLIKMLTYITMARKFKTY